MKTFNFSDVTEICLPTIEDVEKLPHWLRANGDRWWLKSPGDVPRCAAIVRHDGWIDYGGYYVYFDFVFVRPVLTIPNLEPLEIGEIVKVEREMAHYIGNNKILLCGNIGHHIFDKETNNYETSEIKRFLEEKLKTAFLYLR